MAHTYKVNYKDIETFEVPEGTKLIDVAKSVQKYYKNPIMVAKVDNSTVGLDYEVTKKCDVDFYDRTSDVGKDVYTKSIYMMMILAIKRILGEDVEVYINNSIENWVCCEILNYNITKKDVEKINEEMDKIRKENLIFTPLNVRRTDAIKYFKKKKYIDKVNVLKYISNSYITLYRLDNYYDYFFSKLAYSTKDINDYRLIYIKDNMFVVLTQNIDFEKYDLASLELPKMLEKINSINNFGKVDNDSNSLDINTVISKLFKAITNFNKIININNVADLNHVISIGDIEHTIRMSELKYERSLMNLAEKIYDGKDNIKMVLLAGPSSSGKTTSAKKLSLYLETKGFHTITLSTDDYFLDRNETPKDEFGEYDFESLYAIDLKLFNSHLSKLLKGEKVLVPEYDFIEGKKVYKKNNVQMKENDILVIEGLHCLNEELTKSIDRKNKYKIFISPFTQLNIDYHNGIHTTDTRKLRRIIRDNRTRGRNAADTLRMWEKIKEGEYKWIYPYQNDADGIINSSLVYELAVLKTYVEPLLYSVEEDDEMYPEAIRLINILRNVLPMPSDYIPRDSVLREFIGNSGFYDN